MATQSSVESSWYPTWQLHCVNPGPGTEHVMALFWEHRLVSTSEHTATAVSQLEPMNPLAQLHAYPSTKSTHVPELKHGFGLQSLILFAQVSPAHPAAHTQLNCAAPSTHVPPLRHGPEKHSSTLI